MRIFFKVSERLQAVTRAFTSGNRECEIARENHLITNYLISESEVVTEKSQTKAWLGKCGKAEVWDFPVTTELSRLLCCLLYGLQTEEMKNLFKGKSLVYIRRCQFQNLIPTFLLCLRLIDMFSANEHAEIFVRVILGPKSYEWFQNRTSAQREFDLKIQV